MFKLICTARNVALIDACETQQRECAFCSQMTCLECSESAFECARCTSALCCVNPRRCDSCLQKFCRNACRGVPHGKACTRHSH